MLVMIADILLDTVLDGAKLLPFLFLTYLALEYLEHKASEKTEELVRKSGRLGPVAGGVLGVLPQCGFATAASNFYAGRVITMGTLIAVYLSTSDEMLPIMLSNLNSDRVTVGTILFLLLTKMTVGIIAGFAIDLMLPARKEEHVHIHEMCEHEHCHCEKGIVRSAFVHTMQIFVFILLVGILLGLILQLIGEDSLSNLILNRPVIGPILAGLVGLIPNCSASVAITQLYIENALSFGAMLSGLLVNAGVGLVVLFKVNHHKLENLKILGLLYGIGVVVGILFGFIEQFV